MAKRERDRVLIESERGGGFSIVVDRATQYEITTDLTAPSSARFELGDDGTWSAIREALGIGALFSISVNDKPRLKGRLLKDWTFVGQLTVGSGLPVTPLYLVAVPGTGYIGSVRARLTGTSTDAPDGYYLNPAAYAAPAAGQWGDAGRNSARGPSQFQLNAAIGRTFRWGERFNIDWRIDANNVLNRLVYTSVNAIVGSPQFGLPSAINQPRTIQSSLRVRF